jgi:hypothetical protein
MTISPVQRIPLIDLRRIALYGPCRRPGPNPRNGPCTKTALRDDIHFDTCPQSVSSTSGLHLELR